MKLYHFTCIEHWPNIEASGMLTLTDSNLMVGRETMEEISAAYALDTRHPVQLANGKMAYNHISGVDEAKIVHLTKNPVRSPEALLWSKGAAVDKTRVRVTVDIPMIEAPSWSKWHDENKGSQRMKVALTTSGGDWNSWHVCAREIPMSEWVEVVDLDTGRVLWKRPDLNQAVTKDDVTRAIELAAWVGMERARIVIFNDKSMLEFEKNFSIKRESALPIDTSIFEDYFMVFMSPQSVGLKVKTLRTVLAVSAKFTHVDGEVVGNFTQIISENRDELSKQRWSDLVTVKAEQCKMTAGGAVLSHTFANLYVNLREFLATPCAYSESRRGPKDVQVPGRSRKRVDSNVSVVVYRKPEKVVASRLKAAGITGRKLDHRVTVSGHYRNQWYASTKNHKRIFVAEHVKGPDIAVDNKIRVIKAVR